jgi:type IX secretion system substrate protein
MKKITVWKLVSLALVSSFVYAQDPVIPVSVITSFTPDFGTDPINTINGVGLDAFPSLTANHEPTSPANSFVGMGTAGVFDYDLGVLYSIMGFSFWNQNNGGPGGAGITGIRDVTVQYSINGVDYLNIPGAPTVFAQVGTDISPPEMFSFTPIDAEYIRIVVDSNWGDVITGYAEIAFSGGEFGVTDSQLESAVSLFPNPAREQVSIANSSNLELKQALFYDLSGKLVLQLDLVSEQDQQRINIGALASGLYVVKIVGDQGQTIKRLVKQ